MARQVKSSQNQTGAQNKRRGARSQREKRGLILSLTLLCVALVGVYLIWRHNYLALEQQNILRTISQTSREESARTTAGEHLAAGVSLGEVNVSGLSKAEALTAVETFFKRLLERELTFFHKSDELTFKLKDIGLSLDREALESELDEAIRTGREGRLKMPLQVPAAKLQELLDQVAEKFEREAVDARFVSDRNGKQKVEADKPGYKLKRDSLQRLLEERLASGELSGRIELNLDKVEAEVKAEDLNVDFSFLASSYTQIPYYDASRIHNLILSCQKINGTILAPGQVYSFMTVMGHFQPGDGWADAGMQSDGVTISGLGGGICQTSTTMFQAAVLAGLDIVEAHNHDLPSDYTPIGQDAMVAYGWADLKIRNSLPGPVKLVAYYAEPAVVFEIYGPAREPGVTTQLQVEQHETIEPGPDETRYSADLAEGQTEVYRKAQNGYKTSLYRLWLKNGEVISRDLIVTYHYPAFSNIITLSEKDKKDKDNDKSKESTTADQSPWASFPKRDD